MKEKRTRMRKTLTSEVGIFIAALVLFAMTFLAVPQAQAVSLFVSSFTSDEILRYNGTTGAFIDDFVPTASGGLDSGSFLIFGPDPIPEPSTLLLLGSGLAGLGIFMRRRKREE